jgi:hypothetical protein
MNFSREVSRYLAIGLLLCCCACGPKKGEAEAVKSLHPPGTVMEVMAAEGNLLQPGNVYKGTWTTSQWYTFKMTLKKMGAVQLLATNEHPEFGKVDLKVSQMGEEFYTSMTSSDPFGPQRLRLPAGDYGVTIVISVDGKPDKTGPWTLTVAPIQGKEGLNVAVPDALVKKIQSAFPGGVHRLAFPPSERPEFDFIMETWLWEGVKDRVVYLKQQTPIYAYDTSTVDVNAEKGAILQLMAGEPVIVYELIDIYAARIYTADGLDGIIASDAVVKEVPSMVNLPSELRLAPPNLRITAPWDAEVQSNGGTLAVLFHPAFAKKLAKGKTAKCLQSLEKADLPAFLKIFNAYSSLPPGKEGIEKDADPVVTEWASYTSARDACLAGFWEKSAGEVTSKVKIEALYVVFNRIRKTFGLDELPIPTETPAILPQPPPPPPPPEPQPQPWGETQPQPQPPTGGGEVIGPGDTSTQPQPQPDTWGTPQPKPQPKNPLIPPPSGNEEVIGPGG